MAVYTDNYNLILPEGADPYDVEDYNENFSTIDAALLSMENRIEALAETAGSAVKSIQRFTMTGTINNANPIVQSIDTVNPDKCIIIMDYLHDRSQGVANLTYTLATNSITLICGGSTGGEVKLLFQIVEFN